MKVTDVTPEDYPPVLPSFSGGVYHLYDYQFFYRNLQGNVSVRLDAYLKDRAAQRHVRSRNFDAMGIRIAALFPARCLNSARNPNGVVLFQRQIPYDRISSCEE